MMVSAIRALVAFTAVSWASSASLQVAAQVAGFPQTDAIKAGSAWYPYRGTVRWTIGPHGQPVMSPSDSPVDPDAAGPTTSRVGWQAPVVPATPTPASQGPWGPYPPAASAVPHSATTPGTTPGPEYVGETRCTEGTEPSVGEETDTQINWWDSAWEATKSGARSGTEAVVGAVDWAREETRDALKLVVGPDRLALRPMCPDCGRRHFVRRR